MVVSQGISTPTNTLGNYELNLKIERNLIESMIVYTIVLILLDPPPKKNIQPSVSSKN